MKVKRKHFWNGKTGFILSSDNASFSKAVGMRLPDITRGEEDLIP